MKEYFKTYLFSKNILVNDNLEGGRYQMATMIALANELGIKVVKGVDLLHDEMIQFASVLVGKDIPKPFYKGFPYSVLELSPEEHAIDQLIHYTKTYGFGLWDEAGHSIFEELVERTPFKEDVKFKEFTVLNEEDARLYLADIVKGLLNSTRPVNNDQIDLITLFIMDYHCLPDKIEGKNTAIRLILSLLNCKDVVYKASLAKYFARFIDIPDILKLVDELAYRYYPNKQTLKKLNLRNQHRKFIAELIHSKFEVLHNRPHLWEAISKCDDRRKIWAGLLHHIHFKPKTEFEEDFVSWMRGNKLNASINAAFEHAIKSNQPVRAAKVLNKTKGPGAVLRNLDYLLSRCEASDVRPILDQIKGANGIVLLQTLYRYSNPDDGNRVFKFVKHNEMRLHYETSTEAARRKTKHVKERFSDYISSEIVSELCSHYSNKLGKVYIDPEMSGIALPIQEATGTTGLGMLPKGSRLQIPDGKKIRAFTYWERVNDIDLSVFGLTDSGKRIEFSWRSMYGLQSDAITFSGDETSGYNGGSEYFDINLDVFKRLYPDVVALIFCNNVYSRSTFNHCYCKAGYMLRDVEDSGEIFEPKTVQTSFKITADGTFAYLFGIDLKTNEFVWLNMSRAGVYHVAGETSMDWLKSYFASTSVMNYKTFFELMASKIVVNPEEADVVVSDKTLYLPGVVEQIHSYDFEKVISYMNL